MPWLLKDWPELAPNLAFRHSKELQTASKALHTSKNQAKLALFTLIRASHQRLPLLLAPLATSFGFLQATVQLRVARHEV